MNDTRIPSRDPTDRLDQRPTVLSALECALVFGVVPLAIGVGILPARPIPALLLVAVIALYLLRRDRSFDLGAPFCGPGFRTHWKPVVTRTIVLGTLLASLTAFLRPDLLFDFPERNPLLWAIVIVAYPLLSVLPQELLYRGFFFHRYRRIFGTGWAMILASAIAFGLVHLLFGNWLAVVMSTVGGVLFASTYARSRSLLLVCLEHALYGDLIFTIGLGRYFYMGGS